MSRPSRACGLKFLMGLSPCSCHRVTPFAGVWIEILAIRSITACIFLSRPSRACGLKWWLPVRSYLLYRSRPSRACGLKSPCFPSALNFFVSRPSRACGLKYGYTVIRGYSYHVTPFAGVWIEMILSTDWVLHGYRSRPSRACGLKYR